MVKTSIMNIWLVTTGSSDVQLTSNEDWNGWWQAIKQSVYRIRFNPSRAIDDDGEPYRLPARVLGIAYDQLPDRVKPHLSFPLVQNFTQELKSKAIEIDQIIVLMSDQENIFPESERETMRCPYWQDTCRLYPVLTDYFRTQFPDAIATPLILKPSERGLDDWDAVLELVQHEVESLHFETEPQTVYVSHQAGTPAISSAVQFSSLARFGDRVKFLVSSEQATQLSKILPSSSYLKGIRKQEAKKLLERHDYSGVEALLKDYPKNNNTTVLLEAAIQWNFAKFDEFAEELQKLSDREFACEVQERSRQWWWKAYEAAYLALVRLDQKNGVEAFFHSFRAVEGLISKWAEVHFSEHIDPNNDSPKLKVSILEDPVLNYFGKSKYTDRKEELRKDGFVILSGFPLYALLRDAKPNWKKDCKELTDFIEKIAPTRNKVFHRLRGLEIDDVFKSWLVDDATMLEEKILKYLNFVSSQSFSSLTETSLMKKVHEKLESAIAQL